MSPALTSVAALVEHRPGHRKVASPTPSQGTYQAASLIPDQGAYERQPIDVSSLVKRCKGRSSGQACWRMDVKESMCTPRDSKHQTGKDPAYMITNFISTVTPNSAL